MKRFISIIACLAIGCAAWAQTSDSEAFANAEWKITELERGAVAMYAQIPMFN